MCYPLPLSVGITGKQSSRNRKVEYVQEVIDDFLCYGHTRGRTDRANHSHQLLSPTCSGITALFPAMQPELLSIASAMSLRKECPISLRKAICLLNTAKIA